VPDRDDLFPVLAGGGVGLLGWGALQLASTLMED